LGGIEKGNISAYHPYKLRNAIYRAMQELLTVEPLPEELKGSILKVIRYKIKATSINETPREVST
jgi:hypothetical protein